MCPPTSSYHDSYKRLVQDLPKKIPLPYLQQALQRNLRQYRYLPKTDQTPAEFPARFVRESSIALGVKKVKLATE